MSLVAYGSSDESSDDEVNSEESDAKTNVDNKIPITPINVERNVSKNSKIHMSLPVPKNTQISVAFEEKKNMKNDEIIENIIAFGALPKPKNSQNDYNDIPEDDDIPLFAPKQFVVDKPIKKDRAPAKISIPSLSEFKDVDEDLERSKNKPTASIKGTGLFSILPPPKSEIITKKNNLIPHVLTKSVSAKQTLTAPKIPPKNVVKSSIGKTEEKEVKKLLPASDYDSNSEDEDEGHGDFFSLSKPTILPKIAISTSSIHSTMLESKESKNSMMDDEGANVRDFDNDTEIADEVAPMEIDKSQLTLISTVMNLPREEILLKNKAEVGPKLPVPEQEFNVDSEGNVAFDDKAIEYLCGKRGVKRKNKMIDEANIIEINGEDIKPDEREWLVKALTEEPVQRPVSMQGAGPSSQSKKKHQITYLAHQAKAMEVELKNTWSQNRMAKKQTQSKYGF